MKTQAICVSALLRLSQAYRRRVTRLLRRDALLYFQRHTVQMMYRVVGQALADAKSDLHPRDYLNFFCLATVEPGNEHHRKSYIYVHAKVRRLPVHLTDRQQTAWFRRLLMSIPGPSRIRL